MYAVGPGTMDSRELAAMQAEVSSLLTDTTTATTATWKSTGVRVYDPRSGTAALNETSTSASVWISHLSARELSELGDAQIGDVRILVRASDVIPAVDDRVVTAATTYSIYRVETGPLSTHSVAYGRKAVS